jgi:hypothetical protein
VFIEIIHILPEQLVDWLLQTGNPLGGETHVNRRSFSQLQDDQREYSSRD